MFACAWAGRGANQSHRRRLVCVDDGALGDGDDERVGTRPHEDDGTCRDDDGLALQRLTAEEASARAKKIVDTTAP